MSERGIAVSEIVARLVTDARREEGLSTDELAHLAGLHPVYVGLLERRSREPTLAAAASLAEALGLNLSSLLAAAEQEAGNGGSASGIELVPVPRSRQVARDRFGPGFRLAAATELTTETVATAIDFAYRRLDLIDEQMRGAGSRPIGKLVDSVDLTTTLADLLSAGIARASNGRYVQNGRDHAPDLLPLHQGLPEVELKAALETTLPPQGSRGAGAYLIFRYVLTDRDGAFRRGKDSRGDTVTVWEVRFGELAAADFRSGPRGKARLTRDALERLELVYYDPELLPYARATGAYARA
ncbi:MAG TPA: helix-turn-helix domain-containing protein [Gaiellaceae bacterium]|nr:helix-turn-helix domain-containing protein [Gaiellaceae bacterium]